MNFKIVIIFPNLFPIEFLQILLLFVAKEERQVKQSFILP